MFFWGPLLQGGAQQQYQPLKETALFGGAGGGRASYHSEQYKSKFYNIKPRDKLPQVLEIRNMAEDEEEAAVLFVITELYRHGIL